VTALAALLALAALQAPDPPPPPAAPPASGQNEAAAVDTFLRTLRGGRINRLGPLLADRVAGGESTLDRSQVLLLHRGYAELLFGPLRSFECDPPVANAVICVLRFQSLSLRQRYTVESGLISGIETLPFDAKAR
jgi:hypothetical protein